MFQTLERVNAAMARVQPTLPPACSLTANRLTFAAFPVLGYSLTSDSVPIAPVGMATYQMKPRLNRLNGVATVIVQGARSPNSKCVWTRPGCWRRPSPCQASWTRCAAAT